MCVPFTSLKIQLIEFENIYQFKIGRLEDPTSIFIFFSNFLKVGFGQCNLHALMLGVSKLELESTTSFPNEEICIIEDVGIS